MDFLKKNIWKITSISLLSIYTVMIIVGALSKELGQLVQPGYDKILHFAEFFIFALLLYAVFWSFGVGPIKFVMVFLLSAIAGVASELIQLLSKTRVPDWHDFAADLLGILFALVIMVVIEWIYMRR